MPVHQFLKSSLLSFRAKRHQLLIGCLSIINHNNTWIPDDKESWLFFAGKRFPRRGHYNANPIRFHPFLQPAGAKTSGKEKPARAAGKNEKKS